MPMSEKVQATVTIRCPCTAAQLYDTWLNPAKVNIWLAEALRIGGLPGEIVRVLGNPVVGGEFLWVDQRGKQEARHWGTYLALERPRLLHFTWIVDEAEADDPSEVKITLQPAGPAEAPEQSCLVKLEHTMDAAWKEYVPRVEASWARMLGQAAELAAVE